MTPIKDRKTGGEGQNRHLDGPDVVKGGCLKGRLIWLRHMQFGCASLPDTLLSARAVKLLLPDIPKSSSLRFVD